jgi:uncharacterized membrane protein
MTIKAPLLEPLLRIDTSPTPALAEPADDAYLAEGDCPRDAPGVKECVRVAQTREVVVMAIRSAGIRRRWLVWFGAVALAAVGATLPALGTPAAPAIAGSAADRWCLEVLATPDRFADAVATDVNGRGLVVGTVYNSARGTSRAAFWRHGRFHLLPTGGAESTSAAAVNDKGVVVGSGDDDALLWRDGQVKTLPSLGSFTRAYDVNNHGLVGGTSNFLPVLWRGGRIIELSGPEAASFPSVYGVSNTGFKVGADEVFPVAWRYGKPLLLDEIDGFEFGYAWKVNDDGVVVGSSDDGSTWAVPVVWRNWQASVLWFPRLRAEAAWADDVNEHGLIVGGMDMISVADRAVAWVGDSLIRLPGQNATAHAVNDTGLIAGHVHYGFIDGHTVSDAAVWRPAPSTGC